MKKSKRESKKIKDPFDEHGRKFQLLLLRLEADFSGPVTRQRLGHLVDIGFFLETMDWPSQVANKFKGASNFDRDLSIDRPIIDLFGRLDLNIEDYSDWRLLLLAFYWTSRKKPGAPKTWTAGQYFYALILFEIFSAEHPENPTIKKFCEHYRRKARKKVTSQEIHVEDEIALLFVGPKISDKQLGNYSQMRKRIPEARTLKNDGVRAALESIWVERRNELLKRGESLATISEKYEGFFQLLDGKDLVEVAIEKSVEGKFGARIMYREPIER